LRQKLATMSYTTRPMTQPPAPSLTAFVMCADDYGMTPEISAGILELAQQQRISATSVMSLSPHWPEWARPLQAVKSRIDVGLHLDWTSNFAIERGFGGSLPQVMALSALRCLSAKTAKRAIEQQLDLFEQHFQSTPDHLDGHQHIHQFPVIRDALMNVLSHRYTTTRRPWVRISRVTEQPMSLKSRVINVMGARALQTLADRCGFAHSQALTGVYDFHGDSALYRQRLRHWLTHLPLHTVLMCHPGQGLGDGSTLATARATEQEVLVSPEFQTLLNSTQTTMLRGQTLFCPHDTTPPTTTHHDASLD